MESTNELKVPDHNEVVQAGIQALIEKLGISKTAIFLNETASEKTNYLQLKEELFGGLTIQEIVSSMPLDK
ncbi:hypothetical protein [Trichothermofontia sp.]